MMTLIQRYCRLTLWNKVGVWGSIASIIGLVMTFFGSPSISQQTHGHLSPAIANNSGSLIIASTPEALKQAQATPPPKPPAAPPPSIWTRPEIWLMLLGGLSVLAAFVVPLLGPRQRAAQGEGSP